MQNKKGIGDNLDILTLNCYHQVTQNCAGKAKNRWNKG